MRKFLGTTRRARAFSPLVGAALGVLFVVISVALSSRSFLAFFSFEGLIIVVGGVIAVAFMSFDGPDVRKALGAIPGMLRTTQTTQQDLLYDMTTIIRCAHLVKRKGMRTLEATVGKA